MRPRAFVFDAYGTLFDLTVAARRAVAPLSGNGASGGVGMADLWPSLGPDWRAKQLEYAWLRSLMGAHADFATVTADALDHVLAVRGLGADRALRARLMAIYDKLPAYEDVVPALTGLKAKGARLAILSNGTPDMLHRALHDSGLQDMFEMVLSVEEVGVFKPNPQCYALVDARLNLNPGQIMFVSANTWDVAGAARAGFTTVWINRSGAPFDRLPHGPAHIMPDLTRLPELA